MIAFYDKKPSTIEIVGNGSFMYRWNIQEVVSEQEEPNIEQSEKWKCNEVIEWFPMTSEKVINAVIRSEYSAEQELSLVNKFNAYQQGLDVASDLVAEYTSYLSFVAEVKRTVRKDLGEEIPRIKEATPAPRLYDLINVVALTVNTLQISDEDALRIKSVYPLWNSFIGKTVTKDMKLQYNNKLWKVLQEHSVQEHFKPGAGTESLYTEIIESSAGTKEDPIPYDNNMELENGKYYIQNGIIYKCTRNTEVPVYNPLADLVGIYVEKID